MADDPHRDLLPVKEGSCIDTCRSSLVYPVDRRERYAVCKLDRYELEDRHLRLLDEIQDLKKYLNTQEEKIKRLSTKLMRVAKTPRTCLSTGINNDNDRIKMENLQIENVKLKDKVNVLKNQILNHRVLRRSSSQIRRLHHQGSASSGPTTYRSDGGHLKTCVSTNSIHERIDDINIQKYINKIQELENEREEMINKILELENQLSLYLNGNQKEKVAENVEFIKVWRQMKQQQDKLNSTNAINDTLQSQIEELKNLLDQTSKSKVEATVRLSVEKKRISELEEQLIKSNDSQLLLREKDEQIRDLMSEIKILQQHNTELISLSTKYSQVDNENIDLKRKLSEQKNDNNNLKTAFNNEKTNITALQAANEELIEKLQDLQKNMDTLTIELKSVQNQQVKTDRSSELKLEIKLVDKETNTSPEIKKSFDEKSMSCYCDDNNKIHNNLINVAVQTEWNNKNELFRQISDDALANNERKSSIGQSPRRNKSSVIPASSDHEYTSGNLSNIDMLKLLDEVQINTPLESHNSSHIKQIENINSDNFGKTINRQSRESEGESGYSSVIKSSRYDKIENLNNHSSNCSCTTSKNKNCCFAFRANKNKICKHQCNNDLDGKIDSNLQDEMKNNRFLSCVNPMTEFTCCCSPQNIPRKIFTKQLTNTCKPKNSIDCQLISPKSSGSISFCSEDTTTEDESLTSFDTDNEGIVELCITSLQLTPYAINQIFTNDDNSQKSVFVTCDYCGQGNIFIPYKKYPNLKFKTTHIYKLKKLSTFIDSIIQHAIYLQIYIIQNGGYPCAIANAQVCIKDILNYPNKKLRYIATMKCTVPCYRNFNLGELQFSIQLKCSIDKINEFKLNYIENKKNTLSNIDNNNLITIKKSLSIDKSLSVENSLSSEKLKILSDVKFNNISSSNHRLGKRKTSDLYESYPSPRESKRPSISYQPESSVSQRINMENKKKISADEHRESWARWTTGDYTLRKSLLVRKSKISKDPSDDSSSGPAGESHPQLNESLTKKISNDSNDSNDSSTSPPTNSNVQLKNNSINEKHGQSNNLPGFASIENNFQDTSTIFHDSEMPKYRNRLSSYEASTFIII
ncbi:putative uncharacterized protein DDB_G0282133 [Aphidius gifuensis]|uniref:putative uncharacterized protein DDB_G0282133 n=1 Tax=Aphidius gifuensis TaxID=684658 RepID=UPI001CDC44CA|nr:putative uncharacterized protein DDB_G0282133 [Aphidius gifuensis]XP_044021242.1 putative uncharacterized protein DDB_G0282133 [Aphidius gifuensis]